MLKMTEDMSNCCLRALMRYTVFDEMSKKWNIGIFFTSLII